jgi:hypothetical protein
MATYNLKTNKLLHQAGRYVVLRDGRQYPVCTDEGQPCNFLGGGKRGLEQATRSADLSAEISQAWEV